MPRLLWIGAAFALIFQPVLSMPWTAKNVTSVRNLLPAALLLGRADDDFDVTDHSDIVKMAAIGDSYSAGIGAGGRLGSLSDLNAWHCSRYDHAYPNILNNHEQLGDPSSRDFQFRSCSGALATEVLEKQLPTVSGGQQVILISAGGNDIGLTDILNQCIYQWAAMTRQQVEIAKAAEYVEGWEWVKNFDFDTLDRGCVGQVAFSQSRLESAAFINSIDSLLSSAKLKLSSAGGQIYYTGYAKFFAESYTSECDGVSWTTWINFAISGFQNRQYLTADLRRRLNGLVDAVNQKLKEAVERAGPSVTFVDYDSYVGEFGGRFCEAGFDESTTESGNRLRLMFYEFNSWDVLGSSPHRRSEATSGLGTFHGDISEFAQLTLKFDPNAMPTLEEPGSRMGLIDINSPLPDGYGRTFHPQVLLHQIISNLIIYHMNDQKARNNGLGPVAETAEYLSCPLETSIGGGVDLRVLPIGDSITWGAQSTDSNGYRNSLRKFLSSAGNNVDFVGSVTSGSMEDNQHEGHRGKVIDEITSSSDVGISASPNIVLLHAGTNDIHRNQDVVNAPQRLRNLIDKVLRNNPTAAIFVCQIVPANNGATQARLNAFNAQIPGIVSSYVAAGRKVTLVNMAGALTVSDLRDELHPNDGGYRKMAAAYYDAILSANAEGWITRAGDPTPVGPELCDKTLGWSVPRMIATGPSAAYDDGPFIQKWGAKTPLQVDNFCNGTLIRPLQLDGTGSIEIACVSKDLFYIEFYSIESVYKGAFYEIGYGREGKRVRFADLNGDGRDDMIYVNPDGSIEAWDNLGANTNGDGWRWQWIGVIASGIVTTAENFQVADIDGDGRADILDVDQVTGEVRAWLSHLAGSPDNFSFTELGIIATGATKALSPNDAVIFGDFTGEGRADYMQVGANGKVNGFVNRRSDSKGVVPDWLPHVTIADGPTGALRANVRFADVNGDGKVDYLLVDESNNSMFWWENRGTGGKHQKGDGVFICDLDGDGVGDYFWIDPSGRGFGYLNKGEGENDWINLGNTANPADPNRKRENIRMGVLTNSRRADYITVEEDTGRALWWENLGEAGAYGWMARGQFATGPRDTVANRWGWSFSGANVHFADLNGDGFDDYLYVNSEGKVAMWTHLKTNPISWSVPVIVADKRDPVNPRDVRFADMNGDGRVDYITLDYITGAAWVWHNLGMNDDGTIRWGTQTKIADGPSNGHAIIKFADMTGDGRAEYMSISPSTGRLDMWENLCV